MLAVTLVALFVVSYLWYFRRCLWVYLRNPRFNGIPGIDQLYLYFKTDPEGKFIKFRIFNIIYFCVHADLITVTCQKFLTMNETYYSWLGPIFFISLKKPEEIKIVLNSEETFDKPDHSVNMFFKYGLLTEGGEKYKRQRKAVTPVFLPSNLKRYYPIINDKFAKFLDDFDRNLTAEEFDVTEEIMCFTLDTILMTMFNRSDFDKHQRIEFLESADRYLSLSSERIFKFWLSFEFFHKRSQQYPHWKKYRENIFNFTKNLIQENETNYQNGNQPEKFITFTDHLYKIRDTLEFDEVLEDIALLILASYETTGSVLPHILLALAMNPEHQKKIYDEVSKIISTPEDEVTEDMCNQMEYLELCIKEGLRLFPAALMMGRQVKKDLNIGNFTSSQSIQL